MVTARLGGGLAVPEMRETGGGDLADLGGETLNANRTLVHESRRYRVNKHKDRRNIRQQTVDRTWGTPELSSDLSGEAISFSAIITIVGMVGIRMCDLNVQSSELTPGTS
jgi:hypothetical protein